MCTHCSVSAIAANANFSLANHPQRVVKADTQSKYGIISLTVPLVRVTPWKPQRLCLNVLNTQSKGAKTSNLEKHLADRFADLSKCDRLVNFCD